MVWTCAEGDILAGGKEEPQRGFIDVVKEYNEGGHEGGHENERRRKRMVSLITCC